MFSRWGRRRDSFSNREDGTISHKMVAHSAGPVIIKISEYECGVECVQFKMIRNKIEEAAQDHDHIEAKHSVGIKIDEEAAQEQVRVEVAEYSA